MILPCMCKFDESAAILFCDLDRSPPPTYHNSPAVVRRQEGVRKKKDKPNFSFKIPRTRPRFLRFCSERPGPPTRITPGYAVRSTIACPRGGGRRGGAFASRHRGFCRPGLRSRGSVPPAAAGTATVPAHRGIHGIHAHGLL